MLNQHASKAYNRTIKMLAALVGIMVGVYFGFGVIAGMTSDESIPPGQPGHIPYGVEQEDVQEDTDSPWD